MEGASFYLSKTMPFIGAERSYDSARYVVFGAPYDLTSSWRPGARYGPAAIRESSRYLETTGYSAGDVLDVAIHDLGDIDELYSLRSMLRRCFRVAAWIVRDGKVPVLLGGEHTFSLPCIMASRASRVIIFDAHLDLRSRYLDRTLCHATWLRYLLKRASGVKCLVIGARGYDREEVEFARERGVLFLRPSEILSDRDRAEREIRGFVEGDQRVYVSLDVDVLDPSFAPGVSNPEPGGIDVHLLYHLIKIACSRGVVGIDVVEVCPLFDHGQTAAHAAKALFEALITASLSKR